jgi:hypothetical protein
VTAGMIRTILLAEKFSVTVNSTLTAFFDSIFLSQNFCVTAAVIHGP